MNIKKNKSGFTLLEIIIVIIIVGVLASLALPRLFSTVEFSRSTEALSSIASVRSSMERCYLSTANYTNCDSFAEIDIEDPNTSPGAHFAYTFSASATTYSVIATRNSLDGGDGTSKVWVEQTASVINKNGDGDFEAL